MSSRKPVTAADPAAVVAQILAEIGDGAAARDRDRMLPTQQVRALADSGLCTWRIPARFGGPDVDLAECFAFIVDLAAADPNVAQAVRSHFGFVEMVRLLDDPGVQRMWFDRILAGDLIAIASGETGGPQGRIATRVSRRGSAHLLNGRKFYSTGGLFADWMAVKAIDDDGALRVVVVPADRRGVEMIDDWDGMGQRLTASGTTIFSDVAVDDSEFVDAASEENEQSRVAPFLQLYLAATLTGIARNAVADAVDYARERARPIRHSAATRSVDDPYVQHAVGEIAALTYACESATERAAAALDRVDRARPADAETLLPAAGVEVAQAQYVIVDAVLRVTDTLFEVGGASATRRTSNLDRHWRNARTLANHNPRAHKAAVIGTYLLTGAAPPTSGYF
ncbi:acyl-CoA dehydrogenase family protein [Millisia brevis]|uniref:acyl-CoA dehydrogenase family protein n=1 Tax=Millisia brevis TaxID=264148 RepID=UPI000834475B|nr:acyl-CoA dehydrogenase family protein [Millisia brevis]